MADAQRASVRIFFITVVLVLIGLVGLGIFYLASSGENIGEGESEREDVMVNDEAETLERIDEGDLVLTEYTVERSAKVVEGSVLNNTNQPFVNVQVAFELLDADRALLAVVRDTASEVGPGESWYFRVSYPPDVSVAHADLAELTGYQKEVIGRQADPTYEQNEPDYEQGPEN